MSLAALSTIVIIIYIIGNVAEWLAHRDVLDPQTDLREIEKNWNHDLMKLYSSRIPTRDLRKTMISRKVEMTLYFTDYDPSLEPMRLVEEADAIKIKPSVELTDSQMMEEMQYD